VNEDQDLGAPGEPPDQGAGDVLATARTRAEWHDDAGRMLDRLASSPGAQCAQRGGHREPRTWDRAATLERRRPGPLNRPAGLLTAQRAGGSSQPTTRHLVAVWCRFGLGPGWL
jgi:hypothetical protein